MKNWKEWVKLLIPPAIAGTIGVVSSSQFVEWMATVGGIALLVPILVEYVKDKFNLSGKEWKFIKKAPAARWLTWGLCAVLIVLSYLVGWGFQSIGLLSLFINVVAAGLIANGYYEYKDVMYWLAIITDNIEKQKRLKENGTTKN